MEVFPITFEVPAHPEPIDLVRSFAFGVRGYAGGKAGNPYHVPTDLDAIEAIRVQVPIDEIAIFYDALEMLVAVNLWCIRARLRGVIGPHRGSGYASVYESVCYRPKVRRGELWDSIEALHQRGHGVCEDLACARVAERRFMNDPCRPKLIPNERADGGILFHVVVEDAGGIEDPSGVLGMTPGQTSARCRLFLERRRTTP